MKQVKDIYITSANKGQTDYYLNEEIHGISNIKIDGKNVEFEVVLRLAKQPKKYTNLDLHVKRNRAVFRKKGK